MAIIRLDASTTADAAAFEDWHKVGLPLSQPACALRGMKMAVPLPGEPEIGVWECSPGQYRRQIRSAEAMHVISGEATFTPDGGLPTPLKGGDVFFFPPDTVGVWDIKTPLRKVYLLFTPG